VLFLLSSFFAAALFSGSEPQFWSVLWPSFCFVCATAIFWGERFPDCNLNGVFSVFFSPACLNNFFFVLFCGLGSGSFQFMKHAYYFSSKKKAKSRRSLRAPLVCLRQGQKQVIWQSAAKAVDRGAGMGDRGEAVQWSVSVFLFTAGRYSR